MEILFIIACWILWPVLCVNLAKSKNKDTGMAILGGIFFGLFAVLYYATAPKEEVKT
jgi:hypothetical protein